MYSASHRLFIHELETGVWCSYGQYQSSPDDTHNSVWSSYVVSQAHSPVGRAGRVVPRDEEMDIPGGSGLHSSPSEEEARLGPGSPASLSVPSSIPRSLRLEHESERHVSEPPPRAFLSQCTWARPSNWHHRSLVTPALGAWRPDCEHR